MVRSSWLSAFAFVAGSTAQFATFSKDKYSLAVNVPANTASSKDGSIYFQISAPSDTQWVGFGQGSSMIGANMFVVYAASSSNVTVSPRLATGYQQPNYNSDAQITILDGTQVNPDGSFVANVRCDSCINWSGGSMDPTDSSSSWIYAYKSGSAVDSSSPSANIQQHDDMSSFSVDLTQGTGGSSSNPFVQSSTGTSGSPSTTAGAGVPIASSSSASSSSSSSSSRSADNTNTIRSAHGVIMSILFLIFFPLAALTIYFPYKEKVRYIHGPLQVLSLLLLIAGLALGVILGQRVHEVDGYHQIVGYIIVVALVLFQPALGIYQHMYYRRSGGRSPMGIIHRWLGRCVIILGVVNGGLGFMQSGPVNSTYVPSYSVVAYSIVAGVVFVIYMTVIITSAIRARRSTTRNGSGEKDPYGGRGYEMHTSPNHITPPQSRGAYNHQPRAYNQAHNYSRQPYR